MSLIPVAATLIRRAAIDETYAQELHDAVAADQAASEGLVYAPIEVADLGWLSPSEWHWFARWRQGIGGPLDALLLDYLAFTGTSRAARFDLRGIVMRDPHTVQLAPTASSTGRQFDDTGLRWLQRHAHEVAEGLELTRDSLQYATPAAWFTLRVLTSLDDPRGDAVREALQRFAAEREVSSEITSEWTR